MLYENVINRFDNDFNWLWSYGGDDPECRAANGENSVGYGTSH